VSNIDHRLWTSKAHLALQTIHGPPRAGSRLNRNPLQATSAQHPQDPLGSNHREEKLLAFKDILVSLTSYPEPSPLSVVDNAIAVAAIFGAHLTALSCETHVEVPGHVLGFANIPGIIAGERAKSRKNAQELLAGVRQSR
jgi:hypothetical protein